MKKYYVVLFLILSLLGCEEEPLPPCQLSQTGWVCPEQDAGKVDPTEKDAGTDPGENDMRRTDVTPSMDMPPSMVEVTSCADVKTKSLPTGNYDIDINGQKTKVHCNSDIDGGGWTLVGRSVADGSGAFGWGQKAGSVADDSIPYSLGANALSFTETLIMNYSSGKVPGDRQYIVSLPDDFLTAYATTSFATTVRSPTNSCQNAINGEVDFIFARAGKTSRDHFWFRNVDLSQDFLKGLGPAGWDLFFTDCSGGELHTKQGLIFVR